MVLTGPAEPARVVRTVAGGAGGRRLWHRGPAAIARFGSVPMVESRVWLGGGGAPARAQSAPAAVGSSVGVGISVGARVDCLGLGLGVFVPAPSPHAGAGADATRDASVGRPPGLGPPAAAAGCSGGEPDGQYAEGKPLAPVAQAGPHEGAKAPSASPMQWDPDAGPAAAS